MELKSFNRLVIKIKLEGGTIMDYRIEKRESFTLLKLHWGRMGSNFQ
jgi:AraC family transcriptional regulator